MKLKLALALGLMLMAAIVAWVFFSPNRVITEVTLQGEFEKLSPRNIEFLVEPYVGESFWQLDLERLHADILNLDWVYQVKVKRRWPSTLVLDVVEQTPVVRWGEDGLLNQHGDIFYPHDTTPYQRLVRLKGEAIQSRDLLQKLALFQNAFSQLDWTIDDLTVQADGSWELHFVSGVTVVLDSSDWQVKLDRFIRAYPSVKPELRKFAQLYDLRYSNGFVIKGSPPISSESTERPKAP